MKNSKLDLPLPYKLLNSLGKLSMALGMSILRLDEQTVCDSARKQTGLKDFGDPYYRQGLLRLLDSFENDANLHPIGRFMAKEMVVNYLIQRLRLVKARKKEPEIFKQPAIPPLIITGLARSGTTFLQRMLALDPTHRSLPEWLLIRPFPDDSKSNVDPDPRYVKMERNLNLRKPLLPGIDAIHYTRADTPEECIMVLGLTFNSLVFNTLFPVSGYQDWYLGEQNNFQKYKEYYWLLQFFQSLEPEQRLILKAPAHTGNLNALKQEIPQAMIIQTHREPVTCISSVCSFLYTFYRAVSDEFDIEQQLTSPTVRTYESWFRRSIAYREAHPGVVFDVFYKSLVSDPIGTVHEIYTHFDLPWSKSYEADLEKFVHGNPKDKHGHHRYTASDFGLNESELVDRFKFYTDHFGSSNF
jgi:hypothetical protein